MKHMLAHARRAGLGLPGFSSIQGRDGGGGGGRLPILQEEDSVAEQEAGPGTPHSEPLISLDAGGQPAEQSNESQTHADQAGSHLLDQPGTAAPAVGQAGDALASGSGDAAGSSSVQQKEQRQGQVRQAPRPSIPDDPFASLSPV
jgi:hypothetical protein